jgi:hypothetical protein
MGFLFVLTLIALSVVIGFLLTDRVSKNIQDKLDTPKPENIIVPTKKCPRCSEKIDADAIKCKHCGSLFNVF